MKTACGTNRPRSLGPLRELHRIVPNHPREDGEGVDLEEDNADDAEDGSRDEEVAGGEGVGGVGDEVGRRGGGQEEGHAATAGHGEQERQRVEAGLQRHARDDGDHDGGAGGVGGEHADDDHSHRHDQHHHILRLTHTAHSHDVHALKQFHLVADPRGESARLRAQRQREAAAEQQDQVPRQALGGAPGENEGYGSGWREIRTVVRVVDGLALDCFLGGHEEQH